MRQALSEAGQLLLLSPEHPAAGVVLPDDLPGRDLTGADGVKAGEGLAPVGQRRSHHQSSFPQWTLRPACPCLCWCDGLRDN